MLAPGMPHPNPTGHDEGLAGHARAFVERFGSAGTVRLFFAPGRVNLMGAHLDYNGGPVMPTAIDRGTWIAARRRPDSRIVLASSLEEGERSWACAQLPERASGHWSDYPLGVIRAAQQRVGPGALGGMEVLFGGNLPIGAGLSSSASICVGTALLLARLLDLPFTPKDWVELALQAERGFVGVNCGIMDPHAIGLARRGELLWLDCKDASHAYMPLDSARLAIAVADTRVRRQLAASAFNERVAECRAAFESLRRHVPGATCLRDIPLEVLEAQRAELSPAVARRAEHVLREVARTFAARAALERGDVAAFGAQMSAAHESLRSLFEVSVPELDRVVASATAVPGVLGARLTGAGFGGCVVILLERGAAGELEQRVLLEFERAFGHAPHLELFGGDMGPREIGPA